MLLIRSMRSILHPCFPLLGGVPGNAGGALVLLALKSRVIRAKPHMSSACLMSPLLSDSAPSVEHVHLAVTI